MIANGSRLDAASPCSSRRRGLDRAAHGSRRGRHSQHPPTEGAGPIFPRRSATSDADHGRIEVRRHWITGDIAWLRERHPQWPDLASIGMIEAEREEPGKKASRQTRFYIVSFPPDAVAFAHAARQHWGIENGLHWVLDVIYREDECRIRKRHGPVNFATIRHITLNLLQRTKTPKKKSLRVKRGLAALDETFLQTVLTAA